MNEQEIEKKEARSSIKYSLIILKDILIKKDYSLKDAGAVINCFENIAKKRDEYEAKIKELEDIINKAQLSLKGYVVEKDITAAQDRATNLYTKDKPDTVSV